MTKETSIYLDLIRFTAAAFVLIYHSYGTNITGGFLWQFGQYGHTAVIIFFALSGYVISYVATTKEKTLSEYVLSRTSRIYSIALPAILVTLICNELGNVVIQEHYKGPWNQDEPHEYLRYLATLFMIQNI
jgi:peptidoglycan/LPS O-acetylase OafA/YrhL